MNDSRELIERAAGPLLTAIAAVGAELSRRGWAEANAGNMSVRLDAPDFEGSPVPLPEPVPALGGHALLTTGAGTRMRDLAHAPLDGLCLLRFTDDGAGCRWIGPVKPTSELPAHLAVHAALTTDYPDRIAVLHAHPTATITLSRLHTRAEDFLRLLEDAHTEFALVRDRLAVIPLLPPGSPKLARATARVIRLRPAVVWPGHGILATADNLDAALDIIQVVDKAAETALLSCDRPTRPARTRGTPTRPGRSLQGRRSPEGIETFYEVRTGDSDLSPAEFARVPRRPVHVVLDNIRSAFNVGSVFRLADAARAAEVITCGYTAHPPHHKLEQTALGTTGSVPWRACPDTLVELRRLKQAGVQLVAVETADRAVPYHRFDYRMPTALVFGNEALGLSQAVLKECGGIVDIPVSGYKNSINIATAAAIVLYDILRRNDWL